MTSNSELPPNAIAVVGMAARLPGANTLSAFWDNLRRGEESIVTLSEDDLLAEGIPEKTLANPPMCAAPHWWTGSTNSTPTSSGSLRR